MVVLVVDSDNHGECVRTLSTICSATGILCYDPNNDAEPLISLSWIETLSYLESFKECIEDFDCAKRFEWLWTNTEASLGEELHIYNRY